MDKTANLDDFTHILDKLVDAVSENNAISYQQFRELQKSVDKIATKTSDTTNGLTKLKSIMDQSKAILAERNNSDKERFSILKIIKSAASANVTATKNNKQIFNKLAANSTTLNDNIRTTVGYPLKTMHYAIGTLSKTLVTVFSSITSVMASAIGAIGKSLGGTFASFGRNLALSVTTASNGFEMLSGVIKSTIRLAVNLLITPFKLAFNAISYFVKNTLIGKLTMLSLTIYGLYKFVTSTKIGRLLYDKLTQFANYLWTSFKNTEIGKTIIDIAKTVAGIATVVGGALGAAWIAHNIRVELLLSRIAANTGMTALGGVAGGGGLGKAGAMLRPLAGIGVGVGTALAGEQLISNAATAVGADKNTASLYGNTLGDALGVAAGGAIMGGAKGGLYGLLAGAAFGAWKTAFTEKGGILDLAKEVQTNGLLTTLKHIVGINETTEKEKEKLEASRKRLEEIKAKKAQAAFEQPKIQLDKQANVTSAAANNATLASAAKPNDAINTKLAASVTESDAKRHSDAVKQQAELEKSNDLLDSVAAKLDVLNSTIKSKRNS